MPKWLTSSAIAVAAAVLLTLTAVGEESSDAPAPKKEKADNLRAIEPENPSPRSMWVWSTYKLLTEGEEGRDKLFDFAAKRKIGRFYLCTDHKDLFKEPMLPALRAFIARAHAAGIAVEGLDGWPKAMTNPEEQNKFVASLERLLDYNQSVEPNERFDGFQSDVEPHGLTLDPETPEARRLVHDDFVELHRRCKRLIQQRQPENFVFGIAIGAWFDLDDPVNRVIRAGKEVPVLELLADFCDYWAVMAYRDSSEGTLWASEGELEVAGRRGIPLWIGQETGGPMGPDGDPPIITYYDEGLDHMEREIDKTVAALRDNPAFAGIAIHHYDEYIKLPDGPQPNE